jgi:indole-3-glycerol phosphate synthase
MLFSVLTDENFFMGNIKYLEEIAAFKQVPILRKDFIIDEYKLSSKKKRRRCNFTNL